MIIIHSFDDFIHNYLVWFTLIRSKKIAERNVQQFLIINEVVEFSGILGFALSILFVLFTHSA
jgi:hypothetical protein